MLLSLWSGFWNDIDWSPRYDKNDGGNSSSGSDSSPSGSYDIPSVDGRAYRAYLERLLKATEKRDAEKYNRIVVKAQEAVQDVPALTVMAQELPVDIVVDNFDYDGLAEMLKRAIVEIEATLQRALIARQRNLALEQARLRELEDETALLMLLGYI